MTPRRQDDGQPGDARQEPGPPPPHGETTRAGESAPPGSGSGSTDDSANIAAQYRRASSAVHAPVGFFAAEGDAVHQGYHLSPASHSPDSSTQHSFTTHARKPSSTLHDRSYHHDVGSGASGTDDEIILHPLSASTTAVFDPIAHDATSTANPKFESSSRRELEGGTKKDGADTSNGGAPEGGSNFEHQLPSSGDGKAGSAGGDGEAGGKRTGDENGKKKKKRTVKEHISELLSPEHLPSSLAWVPGVVTNWSKMKPVIRSSVAAWISLVCLMIPKVELTLGQASFLVLISAFISPPSDPVAAVFEREFFILLFCLCAWAYSCLAIKIASAARHVKVSPNLASPVNVFGGDYIEAASSAICAVFLAFGSAVFLFLKVKFGPSPFLFACIFACITLDISLTYGALFPYAYYSVGSFVLIPLSVHAAIALVCSVFVFPETVNAQFVKRLVSVLTPLKEAIASQPELLKKSPMSEEFENGVKAFQAKITAAEGAHMPLEASARLLRREFSWGRFSGSDLKTLQRFTRTLTVRVDGLAFFYKIIAADLKHEHVPGASRQATPFPTPHGSPAPSRPGTPGPSQPPSPTLGRLTIGTPVSATGSPVGTPVQEGTIHFALPPGSAVADEDARGTKSPTPSLLSRKKRRRSGQRSGHKHHEFHLFHHLRNASSDEPVGVFESQRYMNLESKLHHPNAVDIAEEFVQILAEACSPLLSSAVDGIGQVCDWLNVINADRFYELGRERERMKKKSEDTRKENQAIMKRLEENLKSFRTKDRLKVLEPFRRSFDSSFSADGLPELNHTAPPHRVLFQCYFYEYHLMRFSEQLLDLLKAIDDLENQRKHRRFWGPPIGWKKVLSWDVWEANEEGADPEEDNPDVIQGMGQRDIVLGEAKPRDPDALPPSNMLEYVGYALFKFYQRLGGGNVMFAIKAIVLTALISLPSFIKSSASFAYYNRAIWAIFLAQLTLMRFKGDTAFGLFSRVVSTFFGVIVGMVIWYITAGLGKGNPYGLGVLMAFVFPILFIIRLYRPGPPITNIIFLVTIALVLGYSWQDSHRPMLSNPGSGWNVAWRRFILVIIGVTAAFIFSFFPPVATIRQYQRLSYATTIAELGGIYCAILSFAAMPHEVDAEPSQLIKSLIAIRLRLIKTSARRANVSYEMSIRGRWPTDRYTELATVQMEIANLLSHLLSVARRLDPIWSRAFLRRTRFLDSTFLGDVLAIITMCSTALRTATPLPQITPAPLMDRYLRFQHGLNVLRNEGEAAYGLPRTITMEVLEDEQYMCFCVGVSSAFGIVVRLDRLVLATKELVGERFHVEGISGYQSPGDALTAWPTDSAAADHQMSPVASGQDGSGRSGIKGTSSRRLDADFELRPPPSSRADMVRPAQDA